MDHWIFQDEKKLKWWLTMLLEVNYQDRKINIGNMIYECKRGESIKSLRTWSKEFNSTPETIRHFFSLLQRDGMIKTRSIGVSTHLTVCNYDTYQGELDTNRTDPSTPLDTRAGQVGPTNKKEKKEKNEKVQRKFIPPSLDEVIQYFDLNKYKKDVAMRAFKYYDEAGWRDITGKPVKNWKQKMIGVWFKEENRVNVNTITKVPEFGKPGVTLNNIR